MTTTSEQTPSKRRVIVADDEETIATTFALILNQAGFEARAVFSGEQVVEILDSFQPEMLIVDVVNARHDWHQGRNRGSRQTS